MLRHAASFDFRLLPPCHGHAVIIAMIRFFDAMLDAATMPVTLAAADADTLRVAAP